MNILKTLAIAAAASIVVGCGSDSDNTPTTQVRVTHASPDAPLVAVKANGSTISGLDNVDYQKSSSVLTLDAGTFDLSVEAKLPNDARATALDLPATELAADMRYDVVAIDNVDTGSNTIQGAIIARSALAPSSSLARLSVLHAHPSAGKVDIYLSTADTLDDATPTLDNFAFKDVFSDTIPTGDVRIRVTGENDKTVLFDTGETLINLAGGSDTVVVASQNTRVRQGGSPLTLLAGFGSAALTPVHSTDENATVRVAHSVAGLGGVDVNDSGTAVPGLTNIAFPTAQTFSDFRLKDLPPSPASFTLTVSPTGQPSTVAIDLGQKTFEAGSETLVFAVGNDDGDPQPIEGLVIEDDMRSVSLYAKVRVVHAHPEAGEVDIYVVAEGTGIEDANPVLSGVNFKDHKDLIVNEGRYDLAVAAADTKNTLLSLSGVGLNNGLVATVFATEDGLKVNEDNNISN